jgi:hypothetical protein
VVVPDPIGGSIGLGAPGAIESQPIDSTPLDAERAAHDVIEVDVANTAVVPVTVTATSTSSGQPAARVEAAAGGTSTSRPVERCSRRGPCACVSCRPRRARGDHFAGLVDSPLDAPGASEERWACCTPRDSSIPPRRRPEGAVAVRRYLAEHRQVQE